MPIFNKAADDNGSYVRKVQDASAVVAKLQERHGSLQAAMADAQAGLRTAALAAETGTDSKAYDKALAELDRLKRDQMRTADALAAARQELVTAERELRNATKTRRTKDAEKLCGQRLKIIEDYVATTEEQYRARQKLHDIHFKLQDAFPSLNINHGGTLLSVSELQRALETELARISSPPPLTAGACPALPGANPHSFGNPATAEPLLSVIESANARLVRLVTADDAGSNAANEPLSTVDEGGAILALPPDGQTVDAANIMPQPRKLAV